jgi:hypothetical protein
MGTADISVRLASDRSGGMAFDVCVSDAEGETYHAVTLTMKDFRRLARPDETGPELVKRCFLFLLKREDKESILARFDVSVIARYFPEFERVVKCGG